MLLLFHIGENLYAIDTDRVIEIVPMVLLRKIEPAPDHIAGVFNYRGNIVPVIDLCRLIRGNPCRICYSSRLIMVSYSPEEGKTQEQPQRQFGLIVERVSETLKVAADRIKTAEPISDSPYFGELFVDEKGIIQTVNWEQLIKDADQAALLGKGNHQANGAGCN
ncbi:chemotaxis protein CheW [Leptolyngbya ohadii]|uniref:chemotaxis protein CheW n=1 Tax=Leptolyngbya ohadii TaxID=1962290 RepID=UPI000B599B76|nr:chemotaxis protein CheW [Leptolyngbya ohadii]